MPTQTHNVRVAIDGPAGTGKSTLARKLAGRIGAAYLDTGAMYRAATLKVLESGVDPEDTAAVVAATKDLELEIGSDPSTSVVILEGKDVSDEIRTSRVTESVSAVSATREVRENLVALQQKLAWSGDRSVVLEGRDIGTVVLPDAEVKVFLTASPEVRAQRRTDQDTAAGRAADYDEILAAVVARDEKDSSRAESPLRAADGAVVVDTSELGIDDVLERLADLVAKAQGK